MRLLYISTLFVSVAAIAYEILLMRVLSIVQWHHFAYMIISLALLGYGASGTFIAISKRWLQPRFELAFSICALLFSVSMVLCFALGQRVPFNSLEVVWNPRQFLLLAVIYLIYFCPSTLDPDRMDSLPRVDQAVEQIRHIHVFQAPVLT